MHFFRRPSLSLEALEQRDCPSLTVTLYNGLLSVSGTPRSGAGAGVMFTQTASNQWQVQDGGFTLGRYNATNLSLTVTQHQNLPVVFDLGGFTSTGGITVNLGSGDSSNNSTNGLTVYDGQLNGNLSILNGSGAERIQLGYLPVPGNAIVKNLTIGGNVTINAKENPNLTAAGQPNGDLFDTGAELPPFIAGPTVRIGGTLNTTGVNAVQLSQTTTVGGNVNVSTSYDQQDVSGVGDLFFGTIGGNLMVRGATTSRRDVIQIGDGTDPASVGGTLNVGLGNGSNEFAVVGPFTVIGNAYVQMGNGNNYLSLDGTYFSNLTVQLGGGNNTDGTTAPDGPFGAFFPSTASVSGYFTLTAGSGSNDFTPAVSGGFAGAVGRTTIIRLGDGNNAEFIVSSANLGGQLQWHSGNGTDSLSILPTAPATYNVYVVYGNFGGTLTLNSNVTISGSVSNTGSASDVFNQDGATIVSPWSFR